MSNQQINKYDNEQTFINDSDWFDIDAFLGNDNYESRKVSFGTIKNQLSGGGGANIYNSNGDLTGDRVLNGLNNDLKFRNLAFFQVFDTEVTILQGKEYTNFTSPDAGITVFKAGLNNDEKIRVTIDLDAGVLNKRAIFYEEDYTQGWDSNTPGRAIPPLSFITANGATANRPLNGIVGQQYLDTDINKLIIWNGSNWIDAMGTTV